MKLAQLDPTKRLINGTALLLGGVIVGLIISKYSARIAYDLGHSVATRNMDQEQEIRWVHFEQHRMESCLAWWFNDSFRNLKAAQFYMCQNRRRWE
jgi:hypothetical protein